MGKEKNRHFCPSFPRVVTINGFQILINSITCLPSYLFKKIRDTKGIFHAKMGSIKDRNGMDLTEAEDIKMSWQEYTEELYKKDLHDPDNHDHSPRARHPGM